MFLHYQIQITFFISNCRYSDHILAQAPAETCANNEKFAAQLKLAGPSMASMLSQLEKTIADHC